MARTGAEPVLDLRLDRRTLQVELVRVAWWRRLVRARIDVALSAVAQPDTLGAAAFALPPAVAVGVPRAEELLAVLGGPRAAAGRHLDGLPDPGTQGAGRTAAGPPASGSAAGAGSPSSPEDQDRPPTSPGARLAGLRDLDARLAAYEAGVEGALREATAALVERLGAAPAEVLSALADPLPPA
ncbi:hypothetical protein [Cellulomonas marina]|uniref:Uncharacterized protein n=1 Tax=Cellulomonas marina TaxID=988821 RepID=A0A1I0WV21_9CELL|nr:hypothetical protein [Cellulomonas marina]GIG30331.1 hypothetical protein Cma02nite_29310 [Cellulomonas marina]SFA92000.1 hypothetical protein SAMN05421867_103225 [Cellulomonas marina]